jgi:NAD(P)-dependent dehydrogenase (short-subunit alcohol dehydrogenase family)
MSHPVVVVTGAAGALGSEVARHLASKGYRPALFDVPQAAARLEQLAKELGGVAEAADITSAKAWSEALPRVERALGAPPSCAALIAGGWQGGKPLHGQAEDAESDGDKTWTAMMTTNLETAHRSLRALLPGMVSRKRGSIVVVGARGVERPWTNAGSAAYGAAKSAVVSLAQAAAAEVLEHGVRINAILPSALDTAANRKAMPDADFTKWVAPGSAAAVIAFLLSDDARDISGAALPLYGRA